MTALYAWLLLNVGVLLLACVAYLRRRHEPVLIEDAPVVLPDRLDIRRGVAQQLPADFRLDRHAADAEWTAEL